MDRLRLLHERTFAAECLFAWNTAWSRANGLSIRHPYTDESVKEYLMQLAGVSVKKPVIRELAARYLPPSASGAPKVFQTIPVGHWFRGPLRSFVRDRLSPARLARRGSSTARPWRASSRNTNPGSATAPGASGVS